MMLGRDRARPFISRQRRSDRAGLSCAGSVIEVKSTKQTPYG